MAIPESQLETWANQGATSLAQQTHESIRNALSRHRWPTGVTYEAYLQGSYRNSTNIRGDSDVDLVVELTSVFYSNLSEAEKTQLALPSAVYNWSEFRKDVIAALINYFGPQYVDPSGSKSIKLLPNSGRLKADVVVAATYRYYDRMRLIAEGITFWTQPDWQQINNFPKLHYDHGVNKNSYQQTDGWYKPAIRIFKNARNRVTETNHLISKRFPSYFIECLFYNTPNSNFGTSFQSTFTSSINFLSNELNHGKWEKFICQNEINYLFGSSTVQWNIADARDYVAAMINLWNNW